MCTEANEGYDNLPDLPVWDRPPADLPRAITEIKAAIKGRIAAAGRNLPDVMEELDEFIEAEIADIHEQHEARGSAWPEIAFEAIDADTVSVADVAALRRRGCVVVRGHFPASQASRWDQAIEDYAAANRFYERYAGPGDDFFASVGSSPAIYPIYWSKPQMEARQSERMAAVQGFLNRLWTSGTTEETSFDGDRSIVYPDRIRRRPPGTTSDGLGAHIDPGNIELWLTDPFQRAFRSVFGGDPLNHDPWDATDRLNSPKFAGTTMCSVFRTFQGWTALSAMQQDQGVLHAVPIPLAISRLLLRPLMDDVGEGDLCGVTTNQVFPVTERWHSRVLDALSPVPDLRPGDSVWWHADLIHAVAPVEDQRGWASLMYIPASPWSAHNAGYLASVREALDAGTSPPDFPPEHYEADWTDRFTAADLTDLGRTALGL